MSLKNIRERAGLKQSELATISGVNLRSLQDYEQGHKAISSAKGETLFRLSLALGCSIEDILGNCEIDIDLELKSSESAKNRISEYEARLAERREKTVHFPVVVADKIVDMSKIYPTKQAEVKRVLNRLRHDNHIESLRIFGSSITMACNKDSDIDLAVDLKELTTPVRNDISEKIQLACDWSADIIWMDHLSNDERIYKDIMKGLVLI